MLTTSLAGLNLENPTILASGILGTTASSLAMVANAGAGAVTTKSCSLQARKGHPTPCVLPIEQGMLNAVGLSNPGAQLVMEEITQYKQMSKRPLIASVFGASPEDFYQVTKIIAQAQPDMIEVNVSCPNVSSEFGQPFGADFEATRTITQQVKKAAGKIPVSIKLTDNCPSIAKMAHICQDSGADALTVINTVGPGMAIDINVKKPILSNTIGGVSGAAMFPIALRAVYQVYAHCSLPIIASGGIATPVQALQMILAGATAVSLGTAIYHHGPQVFTNITQGLHSYCQQHNLSNISQLIGAAHG